MESAASIVLVSQSVGKMSVVTQRCFANHTGYMAFSGTEIVVCNRSGRKRAWPNQARHYQMEGLRKTTKYPSRGRTSIDLHRHTNLFWVPACLPPWSDVWSKFWGSKQKCELSIAINIFSVCWVGSIAWRIIGCINLEVLFCCKGPGGGG
jgi:hypothetical protein